MKSLGWGVLCASVVMIAVACGGDDDTPPSSTPPPTADSGAAPVTIRVLAINDFHGALEASGEVGGAAYLAAHVAKNRTPETVFVSAGDLIGGSALASGLFHDEPTIEVMNAMGLAYDGVGNHEFDEGTAELARMQSGGCHPTDGCKSTPTFPGATFKFLAANVVDRASGKTIFPAFEVAEFSGARVAFVGLTLEGTAATTLTSAVAGLEFRDEADTVAALVPEIRAKGVETIVVIVHQGGVQDGPIDGCVGFRGAIVDVAARMPVEVKAVVSGHTHEAYNCPGDARVVTSAGQHGSTLTVIDLTIDPTSQKTTAVRAQNVPVSHDLSPDPNVAAIVARVSASVAPQRDAVIGTIAETLDHSFNAIGESPMGLVIADAMLFATAGPPFDADIALMNPGGIRASLGFPKSGAETADGQVTFGEAFAVQPFGNALTTLTVSGAEIVAALDAAVFAHKPLLPAGVSYAMKFDQPSGQCVLAADVLLNGVDPSRRPRCIT